MINKNKMALLIGIFIGFLILAGGVSGATSITLTVNQSGSGYTTIQSAINNASVGDTIIVDAGVYNTTLNLNYIKNLTLEGTNETTVIINATSQPGYATIFNFGNSTTIKNLTLIGTTDSYGYGLKISNVTNMVFSNINISGTNITGMDFNGVNDSMITNVEVVNTKNDFGIDTVDSNNITFNNITTSGNAWGGVGIMTQGYWFNGGSTGIKFVGFFHATEPNPLTFVQVLSPKGNYYNITDITIPTIYKYIVYGVGVKQYNDTNTRLEFYQTNLLKAKKVVNILILGVRGKFNKIAISGVAKKNYYVISGMSIQSAIHRASNGDVIHVANGTYQSININKGVILEANKSSDAIIMGTTGNIVTISADNVTVNYFTITNGGLNGAGIVSIDHSNLLIEHNNITDIGNTSADITGRGIEIISTSKNVNSVSITKNLIYDITSGLRTGSTSMSASGISIGWFTSGTKNITGLNIKDNTITDIIANKSTWTTATKGQGAYGILINHPTIDAQILNNNISNLHGLWSHAIGLEGNTPYANVSGNIISNLTDNKSGTDAVGIHFEDNPSAGTVETSQNKFSDVAININNAEGKTFTTQFTTQNNHTNVSSDGIFINLHTKQSLSGEIDFVVSNTNPVGTTVLKVAKYIEITTSNNLNDTSGNVSSMYLRVNYTNAEVKGLNQNTLRLYWYNTSDGKWIRLTHNAGVNTKDKYVWANLSHFSIYGISGSAPIPSPIYVNNGGGSIYIPTVTLLANNIDLGLAGKLVSYLKADGIMVHIVNATDYKQYRSTNNVIILGGQNAYNGVGGIVSKMLNNTDRNTILQGMDYMKKNSNFWAGGEIYIFAGKNRYATQEAWEVDYQEVAKEIKNNWG